MRLNDNDEDSIFFYATSTTAFLHHKVIFVHKYMYIEKKSHDQNRNNNNYAFCVLFVIYILGSAITGPVAKECAEIWPRIASAANTIF